MCQARGVRRRTSKIPALREFAVSEQRDSQVGSYDTGLGVRGGREWEGCSGRAWLEHLAQPQSLQEGSLV